MSEEKQLSGLEKAQAEFEGFEDGFQSVNLATVDANGQPHASYAPFVFDDDKHVYFYLSGLSQHTKNLETNSKLGILFVEDESKAKQVFARKRLSYDAESTKLERETDEWNIIVHLFENKFGGLIQQLRSMPDFRIFKCTLKRGRFIFGFGAAYEIKGDNLNTLVHVTGEGKGHGHGQAVKNEALTKEVVERIIKHMNQGHQNAVLNYAKFYAKREDALSASMLSFDEETILLEIETDQGKEEISVAFTRKVTDAKAAHDVLVDMAMSAKKT